VKHLLLIMALAVPLFASCKTEDFATPDENQQLLALNHEEGTLLERERDGDDVAAELADVRARRADLETKIAKRTTGGWMSWFLPNVPIPEPVKETMALGLGALLFPRPKDNFKKGVKALAKADWKTAALAPLRAIGLVHTNDDPIDVLRGAASAARARGNIELAKQIDAQIAAAVAQAEAAAAA